MTAQSPERFINDHPRVDFGETDLYSVSCRLPAQPNRPDDKLFVTTALWRNYIGTWRLNSDGRLQLIQFEFPRVHGDESAFQQVANGYVTGDFTVNLRLFFYGPQTIVPFVAGLIVEDREHWQINEKIEAVVHQLKPFGLICDCGFIPNSFLPSNVSYNVGDLVECSAFKRDRERGTLILKPIGGSSGG